MKKRPAFQKLTWVLAAIIMIGVASTGIVTNITLRSVEKQLPKRLLTELNELSLILENLSDAVSAAQTFKNRPDERNLERLRKAIEPVRSGVVRLRESYVIDNLVQASAFHAIVAPAVADLQIWLYEGVSGLEPRDEKTAEIIFTRIKNAYQKSRVVNRESRINAKIKLVEQQKRLGHFIHNVNLLFALTNVIAIGMLFLLIRQYSLQQSEAEAQSKLREQRDLLTRLFENVTLGISLWDRKGNLLFTNQFFSDLTGYSKDHVKNLEDWFALAYPDPDYRKHVRSDWENVSFREETIRQFKVTCRSGAVKEIEFRCAFLRNGQALVTLSDVTWRVKAEEDRISAQKLVAEHKKLSLVGQIAGKMAHDFNNILGIIMGNAELAILDSRETETVKILKFIYEQTVRGKNLTKNLIAFAKDQEPKQEFFKLNEKIALVVNLMRKDLEGINLRIEKTGLPDLLADPGMIEHALVNLIQNSVHALSRSDHRTIIIRTRHEDSYILLEIEDNGCGIPLEQQADIYEPSFTLKGSKDILGAYSAGIKGTGYGMANVRKYIEQHNGDISLVSEPGSGTTFTIRLPVIEKELTRQEKTEIREETLFSGKRILLVEDETSLADVQYRILTGEPCRHTVDIAKNGQEAIDLFNTGTYEFVSLDYVLPGNINGMNIYAHIRKKSKTIPILFISGNIEFLESIKTLRQNDRYIDHLSKPCRNADYIKGINKLLEKTSVCGPEKKN